MVQSQQQKIKILHENYNTTQPNTTSHHHNISYNTITTIKNAPKNYNTTQTIYEMFNA